MVVFSILNWVIEGVKWSRLISKVERLSTHKVAQSILLGLTANLIAPNRTGDLIGRLRFIPKGKRWSATYLNFFSGMSQLMVTFLMGLFSLLYILLELTPFVSVQTPLSIAFLICLITLSLFLFFLSNSLKQIFLLIKNKREQLSFDVNFKDRASTLGLSLLRYLVFVLQFYWIILSLNSSVSLVESSVALSLIFFMNSCIPANWLVEVIAKGGIAFFVFQWMDLDPMTGVYATSLLWLVNLFIPSMVGVFFLKDINWYKIVKRVRRIA